MVRRIQGTPIKIDEINTGSSAICKDWMRRAFIEDERNKEGNKYVESLFINGKPLWEVITPYLNKSIEGKEGYPQEITEEQLRQFFKAIILHKISDEQCKDQAAEYLMTAFHQGGWLNLVGGALATGLSKSSLNIENPKSKLCIQSHVHGFSLNDQVEASVLRDVTTLDELRPDAEFDYVLKANVSANLIFAGQKSPQRVEITTASIDFGNKTVKERVTNSRSFLQKIIDFISSFFDRDKLRVTTHKQELNKLESLEEPKDQDSTNTPKS